MAAVGICIGAAFGLTQSAVERLSLVTTIRLATEVTTLSLVLSVVPSYVLARAAPTRRLSQLLLVVAGLSLLVPTIARTLTFSAAFAYYGPVAVLLRTLRLWPEGEPLGSSHTAVLASLVTLYLPLAIIIVAEGVRGLGRLPDQAATLGARPVQVFTGVVLPGLARSIATAGLIVFSQVLGVIVTPRVLGSNDVTIAMLVDDLLKRQLDTASALRVVAAEVAVALPIACIGAFLMRGFTRAPRRSLQPAPRSNLGWTVGLVPIALLSAVPAGLMLLAVTPSRILSFTDVLRHGLTGRWFEQVLADPGWKAVVAPSLGVWSTALALALLVGGPGALFLIGRPKARLAAQWAAFFLLLIPQNALAVIMALGVSAVPVSVPHLLPSWALAGIGEAAVGAAFAYLLFDRAQQRLTAPLKAATTLGAGTWMRFRLVMLPALLPTVLGTVIMVSLVSLDDIVFVRYLPRTPVNTFATELFARARYGAAPDLAAASVLVMAAIVALAGLGLLAAARVRRPDSLALGAEPS